MVRGGCLPVRGSKKTEWKYDDHAGVVKWKQRNMCYLTALDM